MPLVIFLGIAACAGPGATPTEATPAAPVAAVPAISTPGPASAIMPVATAPGATDTAAGRPVAAPGDYLIGPQDLLKVEVFGVGDLNREVRVNSSGQISLPLIGLVQAAGLTGEQLAADIAARLAKNYLQNPQVTIFIEEFTSQRVTVTGAVKTPNVFPLKGRTTLMQVVAAAGGPTSVANRGSARILRLETGGTRKVLQYDLAAIRDGDAPDPEVQGEDVVQVDTSMLKEAVKDLTEFFVPFWPFWRY
jgi:polysaccharide export outer membrane protein